MKNWLKNKTIVISGASGGLGFSIAKKLILDFDCKVIGIGRNKEKFERNILTLGDKKNNFSYFLFDVGKLEEWQKFANLLREQNIGVDVLLNNAGFMLPFDKFSNYSIDEILEIVNTNFLSYVYATKTLFPILEKSSTPAVINVSSSAGLSAVVGQSMYSATKFAVRGFTDTLRVENKGFYIAGIYPGFIKTDILYRQNIGKKDGKLVDRFMMPLSKATKKIVRKIKRKRKHIVLGIDGRYLSFTGKHCPIISHKLTAKVLKAFKIDMFKKI